MLLVFKDCAVDLEGLRFLDRIEGGGIVGIKFTYHDGTVKQLNFTDPSVLPRVWGTIISMMAERDRDVIKFRGVK